MIEIRKTDTFLKWIDGLKDRAAVARIEVRIDRLSLGNPGQHRNLKGGVSELKISYGPGYRVYYTKQGDAIVILLCGGDKSTQSDDIRLAMELAAELE